MWEKDFPGYCWFSDSARVPQWDSFEEKKKKSKERGTHLSRDGLWVIIGQKGLTLENKVLVD